MSLENNLPAAFDTRAMLEVVEVIPPAPGMFKELFFTTRNVHETEKIGRASGRERVLRLV